jgi:heme/copper-type cytochrome/quinol oxidase subunit 2
VTTFWVLNWRSGALVLAIIAVVALTLWRYRFARRRLGFHTWAEHARFYQVSWAVVVIVEIVIGLLLLASLTLG